MNLRPLKKGTLFHLLFTDYSRTSRFSKKNNTLHGEEKKSNYQTKNNNDLGLSILSKIHPLCDAQAIVKTG